MSTITEQALLADPAPLGLAAFAFTTFLLSFSNAGILPATASTVVMPLALFWGGLGQLITGAFEMRKGNTFGFTAFTSYGAFWLFYASLVLFSSLGIIAPPASAVGVALVLWGVFTFLMWIPTLATNLPLSCTFLFLCFAFLALGAGAITGDTLITHIGGYLGFITAGCAAYTSFAIVTNHVMGPGRIPLGRKLLDLRKDDAETTLPSDRPERARP